MEKNTIRDDEKTGEQNVTTDQEANQEITPKHNPFDKNSPPLSAEEEQTIEQFKEAQTERD